MEIKIRVLVILHSYMIPEYDLKHFYTISNTLIWSWTLLYNPMLNQNIHSRNTHF